VGKGRRWQDVILSKKIINFKLKKLIKDASEYGSKNIPDLKICCAIKI